ncbi:uncharacterized protein MELLADRAFT_70832 [Melampsora larici-populina 98AG31]|uniref:Uncharacterized protein n=1 Tax=Melampsora larici-populina (strain 98AG31 / pathotype 3-4-7) TaxID=747676 RepID=F4R8E5_MELLP|nr:uncharacterized protein MELLADRAFT_70832 [Melampsora larici-populina 98AG31]EGG11619.1 hypothetical protein MELLADRAFT_70832 [Melampsora larici-populina 98AG31]
MAPERLYAEFPINPVKPSLPLDLPVPTKGSGLLCPSCRKPHSTTYYAPSSQPHEPLIGVSCYKGRYYRSYSLAHATKAIVQHNLALRRVSSNRPHQAGLDFAMQVARLIHGDPEADPNKRQRSNHGQTHSSTQTKKKKTLPSHQQCNGYNGKFGVGHTARKNEGCTIKTCRNCCEQLKPHNTRCTKHLAKSKQPASKDAGNANLSQTRIDPMLLSNNEYDTQADSEPSMARATPTSAAPLTQASHTFATPLSAAQVTKFRRTTIQQQAEEREDKDHAMVASKTATFVVWAGLEDDPLACETWRVYAPRWPHLKLNQSATLMDQVRSKLGAGWDGDLRVWIPEENKWVKMQTSIVEEYNPHYRRILICFPGVVPDKCKEMDFNMSLVKSMTTLQKMDMQKIISPKAYSRLTPMSTPTPRPIVDITSSDDDEIGDQSNSNSRSASPDLPLSEDLLGQPSPPTIDEDTPPPPPPGGDPPADDVIIMPPTLPLKPGWPTAPTVVSMRSLQDFLNLTLPPHRLNIKSAFDRVYGQTHVYAQSTVSKYRRWLLGIGEANLANYVRSGNPSVIDGKHHFRSEWSNLDPCSEKARLRRG